jgi:Right handed beta helix region
VIRDSEISDYGTKGILILSEGPATISHNIVTGSAQLPADGIDALFSASTVSYNLVTGNVCPAGSTTCGPDPVNDFQHVGILAGGHPGAVVTHNLAVGNQVGIYGDEGDVTIDQNVLLNSTLFGMELQDGEFLTSDDLITGGVGGVVVVAISANAHAQLDREKILGTSGPAVQTAECCGFTATAVRTP